MRVLPIVWQRCEHPEAGTRQELERAVAVLGHVLGPFDVEPRLQIVESDTGSSSRVWIAGKPIDEWLGDAIAGANVPPTSERMILKAALIASSELIDGVTVSALTTALVGRGASQPLVAASAR